MTQEYDYTTMVDNAMRGVVRDVLRQVQQHGLDDPHHFFITFRTGNPAVVMSDALRSKYPGEITIVLQHQFRELKVEQGFFKVVLSFNNVPERLTVPFDALTGFSDPSAKFGLQFNTLGEELPTTGVATVKAGMLAPAENEPEPVQESAKIIALDAFRKK